MAWTTAGTGDGILYPRKKEYVPKEDFDRVQFNNVQLDSLNNILRVKNKELEIKIDELETKVESLQADLFLKTIMSNMPTLETLKKYSDENDRLIAENNRLTAKISQITQILYDGDDDDEVGGEE